MKKIYFISGLGADRRIYSKLDLTFCDPVFVEWLPPHSKETLRDYALRLRELITEKRPIVIGISLGGMLVTEMAKADGSLKGIIISSNKISSEFPPWLRVAKYLPFYKIAPNKLLEVSMILNAWILGGRTPEIRSLVKQMIRESDMDFVRWAIGAILKWKNEKSPLNLIHIQGTADRLLPLRLIKADYLIKDGTHVLTLDNCNEITNLLRQLT